jgi:PqqD family protein of HPr-rel-A system
MQRIKDLAVSDSGFVFDPYSGATFTANSSALCILDGLKRGLSLDALQKDLSTRFDVRGEDLARDVDDLVASLRLYGLVPSDFAVTR